VYRYDHTIVPKNMRYTKKIIFTWLSTCSGGAEKSIQTICRAIHSFSEVRVIFIVWGYSTQGVPSLIELKFNGFTTHFCRSYEEYISCLSFHLGETPKETVVFGSHRTFAIDVFLAQ